MFAAKKRTQGGPQEPVGGTGLDPLGLQENSTLTPWERLRAGNRTLWQRACFQALKSNVTKVTLRHRDCSRDARDCGECAGLHTPGTRHAGVAVPSDSAADCKGLTACAADPESRPPENLRW